MNGIKHQHRWEKRRGERQAPVVVRMQSRSRRGWGAQPGSRGLSRGVRGLSWGDAGSATYTGAGPA